MSLATWVNNMRKTSAQQPQGGADCVLGLRECCTSLVCFTRRMLLANTSVYIGRGFSRRHKRPQKCESWECQIHCYNVSGSSAQVWGHLKITSLLYIQERLYSLQTWTLVTFEAKYVQELSLAGRVGKICKWWRFLQLISNYSEHSFLT
jgi:hypothetical protein